MYIYIHTNSHVNDIVRLPHTWSGDKPATMTQSALTTIYIYIYIYNLSSQVTLTCSEQWKHEFVKFVRKM